MQAKQSLLLTPFVSTTVVQKEYYFPERGAMWQTQSPAQFGIDSRKLQSAIRFALANEYKGDRDLKTNLAKWFSREPFHQMIGPTKKRGNPSGMILKNGYIIAQWGNNQRVEMACSATKSYLSTVAALAVDIGLIRSLDDQVCLYIQDGKFAGAHNSKVTWAHLLTQSSEWAGELWGGHDWAERPPKTGTVEDWKKRPRSEPGTLFRYNNVRVNLLAYALLKVWQKPLPQILKDYVMDKIGASFTWSWHGYPTSKVNINGREVESVSGGAHWGGGLFISAEDQARYGLLFLNDGKWKDTQVLPTNWVHTATQPSMANGNYGYMWWLNCKVANYVGDKPRHWQGVPESVFYASGFGGNLVVVDKAHDLVIVTRWLDYTKTGEMIRRVMEAL
ncbi:serine hydrolase domain-containing protein [Microscilla marina]|uniref:Beta-lactamase n=1 Tax=Microscilla marina ATCC 23134 TaxID=313606 RepID=A1ZFM3_MICM2|nr:serine hydrolase [Microscilla marina]EAY30797.1 beta-lactamase [Microscilla marina ATCC 23134]